MASISLTTSSTLLLEKVVPLYAGQNRHLFHGQFLVTRTKRLDASLGGLMTPCSYIDIAPYFLTFRSLPPMKSQTLLNVLRRLAQDPELLSSLPKNRRSTHLLM
jgi:hypothetical protein